MVNQRHARAQKPKLPALYSTSTLLPPRFSLPFSLPPFLFLPFLPPCIQSEGKESLIEPKLHWDQRAKLNVVIEGDVGERS
jgi:hypothetical protein